MKTITTVLGRQNPENLGFCHCHEHLMLSKGVSFERNPALCMEDVDKSTQEAIRFKQAGGAPSSKLSLEAATAWKKLSTRLPRLPA